MIPAEICFETKKYDRPKQAQRSKSVSMEGQLDISFNI